MAKAKNEASDGGATRKQATETKKPLTPSVEAAPPKRTKAAGSTTKAAASTTRSAKATEKQPDAAGAAMKKRAPAKATAGGGSPPSSVPLIDTSLAAETAAKSVMNRALLGTSPGSPSAAQHEPAQDAAGEAGGEEKRESSTFKQLKAGLNKPSSQGIGGIFGNTTSGNKGNTPFGGGNQQMGRNQTFGADVNRAGIPRRTGG